MVEDENMKKCSKCERIVYKTEGCNHITCVCSNEFC